jgi:hypothetical protein
MVAAASAAQTPGPKIPPGRYRELCEEQSWWRISAACKIIFRLTVH